ncbi:MAG: FAD-dependent oxidoreductase [Candidatus Babeliales bacterium]
METIHLTPPILSADHIEEFLSCIRPKHANGYQLYGEVKNDKLIIHNYGHSGSGWTLLFGVIEQVLEEFEAQLTQHPSFKSKPICVIGAGCMGLLSAIALAQKGYAVTIVAKQFDNTTSQNAVGLFFPYTAFTPVYNKYQRAQEVSLREYTAIINGEHPFIAPSAAQRLPQYVDLTSKYSRLNFWGLPKLATLDFGNGKQHAVREYNTLFIHTYHMMQQMKAHAQKLGISLHERTITSFDELDESIIINCTGLGAQQLNNDSGIIPVQGHLIRLKEQPIAALTYIIHVRVMQHGKPAYIYFAPKASGILGITYIEGVRDTQTNMHEFNAMLERARDYFGPSTQLKV